MKMFKINKPSTYLPTTITIHNFSNYFNTTYRFKFVLYIMYTFTIKRPFCLNLRNNTFNLSQYERKIILISGKVRKFCPKKKKKNPSSKFYRLNEYEIVSRIDFMYRYKKNGYVKVLSSKKKMKSINNTIVGTIDISTFL